jgi:hypothetical protein
MLNANVTRATSAGQSEQEHYRALTALMVHVDIDHDSEKRVELAAPWRNGFRQHLSALPVARCGRRSWPEMSG